MYTASPTTRLLNDRRAHGHRPVAASIVREHARATICQQYPELLPSTFRPKDGAGRLAGSAEDGEAPERIDDITLPRHHGRTAVRLYRRAVTGTERIAVEQAVQDDP